MQAVGYGAYQRVQAETASPAEVIVLLYDALLKNLRRGVAGIAAGESDAVNEALTRAQDITLELRASLDVEAELTAQLAPLYTYVFHSLVLANVNKDEKLIRELEAIIVPMRDAWVFAVRGERVASPAPQSEAAGA